MEAKVRIPIVFVALFDLTKTYFQIAGSLETRGFDVYYITSTRTTFDWLTANGTSPDHILDLRITPRDLQALGPIAGDLAQQVAKYEAQGLTFASMIMMSRFYDGHDKEALLHYLGQSALRIEDFLWQHGVQWVIGEPTNAPELLVASVCAGMGIHFGSISVSRLPAGRIGFFQGFEQTAFYPLAPRADLDEPVVRQQLLEWLAANRREPQRPVYYYSQSQRRTFHRLAASFARGITGVVREWQGLSDVNDMSFIGKIKLDLQSYRHLLSRNHSDAAACRRLLAADEPQFCVHFLQVQPESSIDVASPFFNNQLEVIRSLRRAIPVTHQLVIKPHPSIYGYQPGQFYQSLKKMPGVVIADKTIDSRALLNKASLASTNTGTVAFEAALLGLPSVIFADMFFRHLPGVFVCRSLPDLPQLIHQAMQFGQQDPATREEQVIDYLLEQHRQTVASEWNCLPGFHPPQVIAAFVDLIERAITQAGSPLPSGPEHRPAAPATV